MISHQHVWIWQAPVAPEAPLDLHIEALAAVMDSRTDALERLAVACEMEVLIGFGWEKGHGSVAISHDSLARLARHPVSLRIDLYPPDDPTAVN